MIEIMKKPEKISWEDIRQIICRAHGKNLSKGLVVSTTTKTNSELEEGLGDGECYIAIIKDEIAGQQQVVGVAAVKSRMLKIWYAKGLSVHFMYDAVLPEYQGQGVYRMLQKKRYGYAKSKGINCITTNTAENNYRMRYLLKKQGFESARLFSSPTLDHYSINWVKWIDERPFPKWYVRIRYFISSIYTKSRYRVNHKKRFGI